MSRIADLAAARRAATKVMGIEVLPHPYDRVAVEFLATVTPETFRNDRDHWLAMGMYQIGSPEEAAEATKRDRAAYEELAKYRAAVARKKWLDVLAEVPDPPAREVIVSGGRFEDAALVVALRRNPSVVGRAWELNDEQAAEIEAACAALNVRGKLIDAAAGLKEKRAEAAARVAKVCRRADPISAEEVSVAIGAYPGFAAMVAVIWQRLAGVVEQDQEIAAEWTRAVGKIADDLGEDSRPGGGKPAPGPKRSAKQG